MRASVPLASVIIHTLPAPVARPPSVLPVPNGTVAVTLPVFRSTRESVWSPQFGTHRLSKPIASPEHGLLPTVTVSAVLLVFGSRRATLFFGLFETHTDSPTAIQSGAPGTSKTASGLSEAIGICTPGVFTPVLTGFASSAYRATRKPIDRKIKKCLMPFSPLTWCFGRRVRESSAHDLL